MKRARRISRRTLLRGVGSIAIGLPFLEEMLISEAFAQSGPPVPTRLVTMFFGLGLDPSWQNDFNGPLEPYAPFADRMAMLSVRANQGTKGGAHCNPSTVIFVGEEQPSENVAGGPSIDQLARTTLDPTAPSLVSGLWWRRGACDAQANRVYNVDGTPRPPIKRPSAVFDQVFGTITGAPPSDPMAPIDEERARQQRIQRSILDTVMEEYRHLTSQNSPLGALSKQKVSQHLDSIRAIERQLAPVDEIVNEQDPPPPPPSSECQSLTAPTDPDLGDVDYDRFTYGTGNGAPALTWTDAQAVYRLHADLWASALRCDRVRFGNLMFESAGGHMNLSGTYSALGSSTTFPGASQHDSYFHDDDKPNARLYQHYAQTNLAYFLSLLDDESYLESNGKTVLDNTALVIGTEYGWNHSRNNVFHAVVGRPDLFNSGFFTDRTLNCADVYTAVASAFGINRTIGGEHSEGDASFLLR
ncbi:MAG: DUF1552 domain-containing protein [Myxococcota bacterium]